VIGACIKCGRIGFVSFKVDEELIFLETCCRTGNFFAITAARNAGTFVIFQKLSEKVPRMYANTISSDGDSDMFQAKATSAYARVESFLGRVLREEKLNRLLLSSFSQLLAVDFS
jgi:hypothetical protein